jgi:hypothetical protein
MPHVGYIYEASSSRLPHWGFLIKAVSLRLSNVGYLYEDSSPWLPHWGFLIKAASLKLPHWACFTEASLLRLPHWGLLTEAASLRLPYWGCLTEASLRRFPHCNPLVETSSLKLPHWRCHILTSSTGFLNSAVSLGLPHQFSLTMVKHGWCCRHGQRNPLMLMWYAVLFAMVIVCSYWNVPELWNWNNTNKQSKTAFIAFFAGLFVVALPGP